MDPDFAQVEDQGSGPPEGDTIHQRPAGETERGSLIGEGGGWSCPSSMLSPCAETASINWLTENLKRGEADVIQQEHASLFRLWQFGHR